MRGVTGLPCDLRAALCRSGGKLDLGCGDPIRLRILLDGSVCEIFTSLGQVLTVRVNRCAAGAGQAPAESQRLVPAHGPRAIWPDDTSLAASQCRPSTPRTQADLADAAVWGLSGQGPKLVRACCALQRAAVTQRRQGRPG